ncbi:MAG: alpha/beta hydrolase [Bacteroidetes bacterium]|nr:alpha/beta hydrolase [Bacteroidota bacterium]
METQRKDIKEDTISGFAPVNGLNMYYEMHGEGKPLVLIHGGGSTIQTTFSALLPLFARSYKVIAVELQAHGHTKDRDSSSSFAQDADDVVALLSYLKINKADFLGFSNGGHALVEMGIRHPAIINKLVIISSFYKREGAFTGFFDNMDHATLDNMPVPLKEAYLKIPGNDSAGLTSMFNQDKNRMIHFKDWDDKQLASIKAPCFIINGTQDVGTVEHAVKMAHVLPNAELMILPGTHGSFIGEIGTAIPGSKMPEMTVVAIEEFLSK